MPITVKPGLWLRHDPGVEPVSLVVDVSRSGREYPALFRSPLPFSTVHDNVSMYVDDLFGDTPAVGGTLLFCSFPNTFVDVNRSELDLDPAAVDGTWPVALAPTARTLKGLGLIKTRSRHGEPFLERALTVAEIEERLAGWYRPYHAELKHTIDRLHARFGVVRQISCHCMSATGASTHPDAGKPRADFCVSDLHGTTCTPAFIDFVAGRLRSYGYSVSINDPYVGNELIRRHGNPARGVDSIQIEVNKRLFMDTRTFRPTAGLTPLRADIARLLGAVADDTRERSRGH